jgi:hypothetical protein
MMAIIFILFSFTLRDVDIDDDAFALRAAPLIFIFAFSFIISSSIISLPFLFLHYFAPYAADDAR